MKTQVHKHVNDAGVRFNLPTFGDESLPGFIESAASWRVEFQETPQTAPRNRNQLG